MKVVILAGGLGTRISEETHVRPKPMVEIGGMPILWHIMKIYSHHGFNDFIVCLGYKGEVIKEWFAQHHLRQSDVTFDFVNERVEYHAPSRDPWQVTLIDTGKDTMTGGRIARVKDLIRGERFMMTYGDGVSDIDIAALIKHHESYGKVATMTTVIPDGRFGAVDIDTNNGVVAFNEKKDNQKRINGGFFVLEPAVFDYLRDGDATVFEQGSLRQLVADAELVSYPHNGFWHPMDTLSDKHKLEGLWASGAPWRVWSDEEGTLH
jgi:glucose-1-phosphate cytidylyltransferase